MKSLRERFDAKWMPEPFSGCWLWIGRSNIRGYSHFRIGRGAGSLNLAHRVAWTIFRGQIPNGMNVLHQCDTPACVNPDHLFLGSQSDNVTDMCKKNRQAREFRLPHTKLSNADVLKIRAELKKGRTQGSVAKDFDISKRTISDIGNFKRRQSCQSI